MEAIPMELRDVQNYINENHRHHKDYTPEEKSMLK